MILVIIATLDLNLTIERDKPNLAHTNVSFCWGSAVGPLDGGWSTAVKLSKQCATEDWLGSHIRCKYLGVNALSNKIPHEKWILLTACLLFRNLDGSLRNPVREG